MLRELLIRDFKLLRDVSLKFTGGMTALTGETGAGKTQSLEALVAALGARSGEDAISRDSDKAEITAVFDLTERADIVDSLRGEGWLDEAETEIILERTIERNGPSKGRLNGRRVPLGALQAVGERLVDTLGQNARADILTRPALEILDSLGDGRHQESLSKVRERFGKWRDSARAYETEKEIIERVRERRDLAEFQYSELKKAELATGEEEDLTRQLDLLSSTKERIERARAGAEILAGEQDGVPTARDLLQSALDAMQQLSDADASMQPETARLREMVYLADELARTLQGYADGITDDPERRGYVEERIRVIHQLKRKYRVDEAGLIELRDSLKRELDQVATADDRLKELADVRDDAMASYLEAAEAMSKSRHSLAKKISKEVKRHLADLDLPNATFEAALGRVAEDAGAYRADGIDRAELLIATNAAQTPGPLRKVASGGELSRLLIALKTVLANRDRVPVLVFDEAEAGIGGETAFRVGEKLAELSESHQLILVSHLPQIACQARSHWVIEKSTRKGEVQAEAREVQGQSRVEEISRMLGSRGDKKALEKLAKSFLSGK